MKKFIITVDTEGDNLWHLDNLNDIHTENVLFLPRFQQLCESYDFYPVWLTNWEMLEDIRYLRFMDDVLSREKGELGMHLHAWNQPPIKELKSIGNTINHTYLIEYPVDVMYEKIQTITRKIKKEFSFIPVSHRAGRWLMNDDYFKVLAEVGYKVDCSIIPGFDWRIATGYTGIEGPNYTKEKNRISDRYGIKEIPMTTYKFYGKRSGDNLIKGVYHHFKPEVIMFRPNGRNLDKLVSIIDSKKNDKDGYIMFMIHSSELMPGCQNFKTEQSIEELYIEIEQVFRYVSHYYEGCTLAQYLQERK